MTDISRRDFVTVGVGAVAAVGLAVQAVHAADNGNGFAAASSTPPSAAVRGGSSAPGLQGIYALCEVTGGGEKVYGIAAEYDANIDPASLALDTYSTFVVPAAEGFFPGMPQEPDKNATTATAKPRAVAAIYTNAEAALRPDQKSVAGKYVITEFQHDPDLSLPTTDSDKVALTQDKNLRTVAGTVYAASAIRMEQRWSEGQRRRHPRCRCLGTE